MTTIDHVSDTNGQELHRLSKLYDLPTFVKQADYQATMRPSRLAPTVYADPRPGKGHYPCHTAASTFLSALFFQEKSAEYTERDRAEITRRLDHYISYWKIKSAVDAMRDRHAELHKTAMDRLPDSSFAYVWVQDDGRKQRYLPLRNAIETKEASAWLFKHRDQLPYVHRHVIAGKILEKAAEYGANLGDLDSYVEKQAGRGICNPDAVVNLLTNRAAAVKKAAWKEKIAELAKTVAGKPRFALQPEMLVKLAETVDTIDRANNLTHRYGVDLERPEDVIFSLTYKEAQAGVGQAFAMTTGTIYDKTQLEKISLDEVRAMLGTDFAKEVSSGAALDPEKVAEVASTLPLADAQMFDKLMLECGVRPIQTKAASASIGFSPEAWEHLAARLDKQGHA